MLFSKIITTMRLEEPSSQKKMAKLAEIAPATLTETEWDRLREHAAHTAAEMAHAHVPPADELVSENGAQPRNEYIVTSIETDEEARFRL